mmetsp:Transcript_36006/g.84404  ORF Transcript_36006/g.84404 Transcript_36006/m.84404 type:complete len:289 (-) Transcript_36006:131-997(-)
MDGMLPRPRLTKPLFQSPFSIPDEKSEEGSKTSSAHGDVPEWVLQRVDDVIMEHFFKVQSAMEKLTIRMEEQADTQANIGFKVDEALKQVSALMQAQTNDWTAVRERDRELKAMKEIVYGRNAQLEQIHLSETVKKHEEDVKNLKRRMEKFEGRAGGAGPGLATASHRGGPLAITPLGGPSQTLNLGLGDSGDFNLSPSGPAMGEHNVGNETILNMLAHRVAVQQNKLAHQEVKCNLYALQTHDMSDDDRMEEQRRLSLKDMNLSREGDMFAEHHDRPLTVFNRLAES